MQIEAAFSLSEEYYKFMSDFAQTSFEDDKLLGKFYTDFTVAKRMVETIVENVKLDVFSRDIKLIDPFCGDGRLISETIIQLIQKDIIHGRKLYISLWDIDEVAVNVAKQNVEEICNAYQLSYEIDAKKYDASATDEVMVKACECCGNPVSQNPGRKQKRFCSDSCRNHWWNTHMEDVDRRANYECVCECCGKTFSSYGNKKRKYCSHSCYINGRFGGVEDAGE